MKVDGRMILLLTYIAVNAENEGPSDYLKSKWRQYFTIWRQFYSRRCSRTCSPLEDDLVWDDGGGKAALSLSESQYIANLTDAYNSNPEKFAESVQKTLTSAIQYLDADQNGVVSAEEFYTENLCMGIGLDNIKKMFDTLKMTDVGVPTDRFLSSMTDFMTNGTRTNQLYDVMKNVSSAYTNSNPI